MTNIQPRDAFIAACENENGVELTFASDREAENFRWRMYQIRNCKPEWKALTLSRNGAKLSVVPQKLPSVVFISARQPAEA